MSKEILEKIEKLEKEFSDQLNELKLQLNNSEKKVGWLPEDEKDYAFIELDQISVVIEEFIDCNARDIFRINSGNYFNPENLTYAEKLNKKFLAELKIRKWLENNDSGYMDIINNNNYFDYIYYFVFDKTLEIQSAIMKTGEIQFSKEVKDIILNVPELKDAIKDYLMIGE